MASHETLEFVAKEQRTRRSTIKGADQTHASCISGFRRTLSLHIPGSTRHRTHTNGSSHDLSVFSHLRLRIRLDGIFLPSRECLIRPFLE